MGATVLAFLGRGAARESGQNRTHHIAIRNFAYEPAVLSVRPGDTVVWTNHDIVPHTATARDSAWDTGDIGQEDHVRLDFPATGTTQYVCRYHPHMVAEIRILD